MAIDDPVRLFQRFIRGLATLEDGLVLHGPAVVAAGGDDVEPPSSAISVFLDFTLDDFVNLAELLWEKVEAPDAPPTPWPGRPTGEIVILFLLQLMNREWRTARRASAEEDRHFRLGLRDRRDLSFRPLRRGGGETVWLPPGERGLHRSAAVPGRL